MAEREPDLPISRKRDRHQQAQVVVRMPIELRDQAEAFAKQNDRTLAQEVRRALRMYLEQFDAVRQRDSVGRLARERGFSEHNQGQWLP